MWEIHNVLPEIVKLWTFLTPGKLQDAKLIQVTAGYNNCLPQPKTDKQKYTDALSTAQ